MKSIGLTLARYGFDNSTIIPRLSAFASLPRPCVPDQLSRCISAPDVGRRIPRSGHRPHPARTRWIALVLPGAPSGVPLLPRNDLRRSRLRQSRNDNAVLAVWIDPEAGRSRVDDRAFGPTGWHRRTYRGVQCAEKGLSNERLSGTGPGAALIMSINARRAAGTCRWVG